MSRDRSEVPCKPLFLRAPITLDTLVEEIGRVELRTKTAVLSRAITEYAERHHPELHRRIMEVAK